MQQIYGVISTNIDFYDYSTKIESILSKKFTLHSDKGIGYGYENIHRSTYKNPIQISDTVKLLIIGEVLNIDFLMENINRIAINSDENLFVSLKDCLTNLIDNINGVFSFILIDESQKKICVFSDKNGIIPIYYWTNNEDIIFASSIKILLTYSKIPRQVNEYALYELFKIGFTVPPATLFKDINMLLPGNILEYDTHLKEYTRKKEKQQINNADINEIADEYFRLFENSILQRIENVDNIALLLSGGVDSAAIAAILSKNKIKFKSYTLDIRKDNPVEIIGAKKVADLFNLDHKVVDHFDDTYLNDFAKVIWYNETPINNGLMEYILCREIDENIEVVLTGDGNDLAWSIFSANQMSYLLNNSTNFSDIYLKIRGLNPDKLLYCLLLGNSDINILKYKIDDLYINTGRFVRDAGDVDVKIFGDCYVLNSNSKLKLTPNCQRYRFPYIDNKLEALVASLPESYLQNKFNNNTIVNKYLFKYALEKKEILPKETIHTKKTWMYSPNSEWLCSILKKSFETIVLKESHAVNYYFNMDLIKKLWSMHQRRENDFSILLMTILNFEIWYRIFIEDDTFKYNKITIEK